MISPYTWRLILLSVACYFLLSVGLRLMVNSLAPFCIRTAERMQARAAAMALFALGIAPFAIAASLVLAVCAPSYLLFEPDAPHEKAGWLCMGLSTLGFITLSSSLFRGVRALGASIRHARKLQTAALPRVIAGSHRVLLIDSDVPVLAVIGVFRSHLVVSRAVLETLSPLQLSAALRHEEAHVESRDNLKRLIMLCVAPKRLQEAWARITERAADDTAAGESERRRLDLAEALVRFAKIPMAPPPPLVTAFASDASDLALRIDRLVGSGISGAAPRLRIPALMFLLSACTLVVVYGLDSLHTVHQALEHLVR